MPKLKPIPAYMSTVQLPIWTKSAEGNRWGNVLRAEAKTQQFIALREVFNSLPGHHFIMVRSGQMGNGLYRR